MDDPADAADALEGTSGRRIVIVFVAVALSFAAYLVLSMPGMSHGDSAMTGMALGVDDFADRMAAPNAFVVNVHTSTNAEIPGTDATIAYDTIATDAQLPDDPAALILLYCKTGRMSKDAAETLTTDGYRNVAYLAGGTDAWVAAGKALA